MHHLHLSRFWVLVLSSALFLLAQISGYTISTPAFLGLLSGLTGLAYGFLFGVYPALVAETFGVHGLSQNWGVMTLSPVSNLSTFEILSLCGEPCSCAILSNGLRLGVSQRNADEEPHRSYRAKCLTSSTDECSMATASSSGMARGIAGRGPGAIGMRI